jgi:hypothetical protein
MKLLPFFALLVIVLIPVPAAADQGRICSEVAHVSWLTDWDTASVDGAVVEVPGCEAGEPVGIQLITEGGDVPAAGPLMGQAEDGRAAFDLAYLSQRIEPVTGVRVFLELHEAEVVFFEITVDRRFFNAPGNEQVGLRQVTVLTVAQGAEYDVPGAPSGYAEVACDEVVRSPSDDVVTEGSGTHVAAGPGLHVVCYQQTPSPRGDGPPTETEVLAEIVEMGEPTTETAGSGLEVLGLSDSAPSPLARTGANLLLALGLGSLLLIAGLTVLRRRGASST